MESVVILCTRATTVGDEVVKTQTPRWCSAVVAARAFPSLAASLLEIGFRVCWWGVATHSEPRTKSHRATSFYSAE